MRPSDLDDVVKRLSLGIHSISEGGQLGEQIVFELDDGRDVHSGREAGTKQGPFGAGGRRKLQHCWS